MPNNPKQQLQYVKSGDPETENSAVDVMPGTLGRYMTVKRLSSGTPVASDDPNGSDHTYRRIRVDSTMTIAPFRGAVAWYASRTGYLVTTDPSRQGRGRVAGVFKNAITPGNYGYIQTGGLCEQVKFQNPVTSSPTETGLIVIPSAEQAHADCLAAGSAATYPILGYSASAYDSTNFTATVDLCVPELA